MRYLEVLRFERFFVLIAFLLLVTASAQARIFIEETKNSELYWELFEKDLQEKTGLKSLKFNEEYELDYDLWEIAKSGSEQMREAITGAIDDELNVFKIIDQSNSKTIHFARTDAGTVDLNTKITTYYLKFDLADFRSAKRFSDKEAFDSFTLAINLFHEIDHKVSYDISDPIPLYKTRSERSVRNNVNFIRWELGLILRDTKQVLGRRYNKDIYEIPFIDDDSGERRFLRWKIDG